MRNSNPNASISCTLHKNTTHRRAVIPNIKSGNCIKERGRRRKATQIICELCYLVQATWVSTLAANTACSLASFKLLISRWHCSRASSNIRWNWFANFNIFPDIWKYINWNPLVEGCGFGLDDRDSIPDRHTGISLQVVRTYISPKMWISWRVYIEEYYISQHNLQWQTMFTPPTFFLLKETDKRQNKQ